MGSSYIDRLKLFDRQYKGLFIRRVISKIMVDNFDAKRDEMDHTDEGLLFINYSNVTSIGINLSSRLWIRNCNVKANLRVRWVLNDREDLYSIQLWAKNSLRNESKIADLSYLASRNRPILENKAVYECIYESNNCTLDRQTMSYVMVSEKTIDRSEDHNDPIQKYTYDLFSLLILSFKRESGP